MPLYVTHDIQGLFAAISVGIRGDHPTKIFPKVSPLVVFTERIDLALVPSYLNRWFLSSFDSKFEVFWAVSGG